MNPTGGFTVLPRPPAAILHAFDTCFCFAKNQCTHIFSVLSPALRKFGQAGQFYYNLKRFSKFDKHPYAVRLK